MFLSYRFGDGPVRLAQLSAADFTRFVTDYARRLGSSAAQHVTTALRSFLRFLQQQGDVADDLASSVPSVARWQLANLPATLTPDDVARLIGECDGCSARRSRSIVMLLARLGLRACEVVRLTLDGIDWKAGELTIHGKGRRSDKMPLPRDGLRASDLTGLRRQDVIFGPGAHIRCFGQGRKERCTPVTRQAAGILQRWMGERSTGTLDPCFRPSEERC